MRKETLTQVWESTESPIQDKGKEEHAKTHINQTEKIKYREQGKSNMKNDYVHSLHCRWVKN